MTGAGLLVLLAAAIAMTPREARKRPLGSHVRLEGHVTVASGVLGELMQDNGFAVSDAITGIYVTTQERGYRSLGSEVEVTGTLEDNGHGLLVLRALTIRPQRGHRLIGPWKLEEDALSEFHEGKLVKTGGEVVRLEGGGRAGRRLTVRRAGGAEVQVLLPAAVKLNETLLTPGRAIQVTGFCAQDDRVYRLIVRTGRDIQEP